jgi:serine-type D-Ala-D-Ala carboxypeptidase (penicillin-binding protein 5/6)
LKPVFYLLATLGLFCSSASYANLLNIAPESVEAEAWTIVDPQSGQIIAEHNSHVQRAPASLTKMMVAYIAFKEIQSGKLNLNEMLTVSPVVNHVMWDESQMRLTVGESVSVDTLLAGLIVMSANDGALMLAERISGNVPNFVARMNAEAKALGMQNTHFANPPGITMPEHYSSAADLALLGQALVNETPQYLQYSKMPNFSYHNQFHHATNLLLKVDSSVDGLKTGFTKAAGYNLALTARRPTGQPYVPERRLVVVVLGTPNAQKRAEVAHKLMNVAYTYTRNEAVIQAGQTVAEIPVKKSNYTWFQVKAIGVQVATTSLYQHSMPIHLKDFDQATQRIRYTAENGGQQLIEPLNNTNTKVDIRLPTQTLTAPLHQKMDLADVKVYQDNQLIRSFSIQNQVEVEDLNLFAQFSAWLNDLWHRVERTAKIIL